jgi:hypothetical protein
LNSDHAVKDLPAMSVTIFMVIRMAWARPVELSVFHWVKELTAAKA